jgi:hypothetical protein
VHVSGLGLGLGGKFSFKSEGVPEADAGNLNIETFRHADAFEVGLINEGGK